MKLRSRYHYLGYLVILAVCVAFTYFSWSRYDTDQHNRFLKTFRLESAKISSFVVAELNRVSDALVACQALYDATQKVDESQWRQFVKTLEVAKRFPGVYGLGFIEARDNEKFILKYFEPLMTRKMIGINIFQDELRRAAALQARDEDMVVMTTETGFIQDPDLARGHLLFAPIYKNGLSHETLGHRRAHILGWVFAQVDLKAFKQYVARGLTLDYGVEILISESENESQGDAQRGVLENLVGGYVSHNVPFRFAGRDFWIRTTYNTADENRERALTANLIVALGLGICLLLFTLYLRLVASRRSSEKAEYELKLLYQVMDKTAIVVMMDAMGAITYCNERFFDVTGFRREKVLGQTAQALKYSLQSSESAEALRKTITSGQVWHGAIPYKKENGEVFWLSTSIVPLFDDEGRIEKYVSIGLDITQEKNEQEDAARTAQLTALGQMAGSVAHEVNTPLAAIIMHCEMLMETLHDTELGSPGLRKEDILVKVAEIMAIVWRVAKTIRVIKSLARVSKDEPVRPFQLSDMFEDTLVLLKQKMVTQGIDFQYPATEHLRFEIQCRGVDLPQVFLNLLQNAVDAVDVVDKKEKWIRVDVSQTQDQIQMTFSNGGPKIEAELAAKIFVPFFTSKPIGRGTGLGLSISRQILNGLGGKLELDSKSPNTSFVVSLPRISTQEASHAG